MSTYNTQNIFARIISGSIKADIVLEDDRCLAFYDIAPKAAIHVIIIPKLACVDFEDFLSKEPDSRYFFDFILKVAKTLNVSHYKLQTNKGANAGQEIMHFHVHLLAS